jgi:hypothetical protein
VLEQLVEQLAGVATAVGATEAEELAFEAGEIAPFGDVPGVSEGLERPGCSCSRRACQIGVVSNSVPSSEVVHQGVPGGTAPNGVRYGSPFRGAERAAISSINREGRVLRSSSAPNHKPQGPQRSWGYVLGEWGENPGWSLATFSEGELVRTRRVRVRSQRTPKLLENRRATPVAILHSQHL